MRTRRLRNALLWSATVQVALAPVVAAMPAGAGQSTPEPGGGGSTAKAPETTDFESLTFELVLLMKRKGDERFMVGNVADARVAYCDARNELESSDPQGNTAERRQTLELLRKDIDYRLLLLDHGYGFWGATQSLTPTLPNVRLKRLRDLLASYSTLSEKINAIVTQAGTEQSHNADLKAYVVDRKGALASAGVNESTAQMRQRFTQDQQEQLDHHVDQLHVERQVLENQLGAAVAQARVASAQLDGIVARTALASTGVPPELFDAVKSKRLDTALISAATSYVASDSFAATLSDYDHSIGEVAGYVRQAQDAVAQGQQTIDQVKAAVRTLRDPSLASLVALGAQITPHLKPEDQAKWDAVIRQAQPAVALVEMIDSVDSPDLAGKLRGAATGYIARQTGQIRDRLRSAAVDYVDQRFADLNANAVAEQAQLIARTGDLIGVANDQLDEKRVLVDQVLQGWPDAVLDALGAEAVAALRSAANFPTREALIDKLRSQGLSAVASRLIVAGGTIKVTDPSGRVVATLALPSLYGLASSHADALVAGGKERLRAAMVKLSEAPAAKLRQAVAERLPNDLIQRTIQDAASVSANASEEAIDRANAVRQDVWRSIETALPAADFNQAVRGVVNAQAGAVLAGDQGRTQAQVQQREAASYPSIPEADAPPASGGGSGGGGGGGGGDPAQAAALAVLTAAYPGVGVAVQLAQSFASFNESIDRAQRISAQLQHNLGDEIQTIDEISEARLKRQIFLNEAELARIQADAASQQIDLISDAITANGDQFKLLESQALSRKALNFYLNERMRGEFEALDRSIAMWTGFGSIASRVQSDPQNVRLQLDQDIHLYGWLDRARENSRSDIDGLQVHWQQLVQLAVDDCQKLGCADGVGSLGKITQTQNIELGTLMSAQDRDRLRAWQRGRSTDPITLSLLASPDTLGLPMGQPLENLRVVNIQLGWRQSDGRMVRLSHIHLAHPGLGYIRQHGELVRDAVVPDSFVDFSPPTGFDVEQLRRRFLGDSAALNQFEGYPLQSIWQLTLEATPAFPENWTIGRNAAIRFAVQYTDVDPVTLEARLLDRANLPPAGNLPAELTRYSAVWSNPSTNVRLAVDGKPRDLKLPRNGAIEVPVEVAAIGFTPPVATNGHCGAAPQPTTAVATEGTGGSAPAPRLIRTCASDADIRRYLYLEQQRILGPTAPGAALRQAAATEFAKLKAGVCKQGQVIPVKEL